MDPRALQIHQIPLHRLASAPPADRVADFLQEWIESLKLSVGQLVPLAHNWVFEHGFMTAWLGEDLRDKLFHYHARDAMNFAITLNDAASLRGRERPFKSVSLTNLCKQFGITNEKPHDAFADAQAEADLYHAMLEAMRRSHPDLRRGCRRVDGRRVPHAESGRDGGHLPHLLPVLSALQQAAEAVPRVRLPGRADRYGRLQQDQDGDATLSQGEVVMGAFTTTPGTRSLTKSMR